MNSAINNVFLFILCMEVFAGINFCNAELPVAEMKRRAMNDANDKQNLRKRNEFVVDKSDDFLKVPAQYAGDNSFERAKVVPRCKLQILPDLNPEYFESSNQYMACLLYTSPSPRDS